ncbi:MAG: hypothetical protein CM1200mP2_51510 [Planctomycetaceae bacterium]|nr:MAG: hypothetical protein CM1200mP2_51510 [Planctomycetaceae bacterium]
MRFPHPGVDYMIHHLLSHNDTADWLKVNQFFIEQLAYIATNWTGSRRGTDRAGQLDALVLLEHVTGTMTRPSCRLSGGGGVAGRSNRPRAGLSRKPNRKMCSLYMSCSTKWDSSQDVGDSTERWARCESRRGWNRWHFARGVPGSGGWVVILAITFGVLQPATMSSPEISRRLTGTGHDFRSPEARKPLPRMTTERLVELGRLATPDHGGDCCGGCWPGRPTCGRPFVVCRLTGPG